MVIPVHYSLFNPHSIQDECGICRDELQNRDYVVGHSGSHPHLIHRECLKTWMRISATCPICRAPIGSVSFSTWKERAFQVLRFDVMKEKIGAFFHALQDYFGNPLSDPRVYLPFLVLFLGGLSAGTLMGAMKIAAVVSGTIPFLLLWGATVMVEMALLGTAAYYALAFLMILLIEGLLNLICGRR